LETLRYITKREKNLSHYSDKLRQSMIRIFNVFGDEKLCRICGYRDEYGPHHRYYIRYSHRYVDELPEKIQGKKVKIVEHDEAVGRWGDPEYAYVEEVKEMHEFKPKIMISIDVLDDEPFYVEEEEYERTEYRLKFEDHELRIAEMQEGLEVDQLYPEIAPRRVLKALVKSERLIIFLKKVAETLKKMEAEYEEVSKIAEQMAKAVM